MPILSDDIQLIAPAPGAVRGVSATITGPPGNATYYYWWVATYPVGVIVVSAPVTVASAPSPLTATNFVTITGQPALGATTYDLLRTNSPQLPSTAGPNNIALATGLASPTFVDNGVALAPYSIAGLTAGAPVSAFINLNNRDFAQPTMVVSPFPLSVQSIVFPNGSSQSTAGATPAQIYSWTQDVQANQHQLLNLATLEIVGGTFGFNWKTTAVAGAFTAGALVLTNETTSQVPVVVNQLGDVWIGAQATPSRQARLYVTIPPTYGGNLSNTMIQCYNPTAGSCGVALECTSSNCAIGFKTNISNYTINVQGSGTNQFYIFDQLAAPNGFRLFITGAGKVGIANGTSFTPAHLLELNADDAAKPTTNTWTISSDIRTKSNVRPLEGGMSIIAALQPIVAEYNGLAHTPNGSRVVSFDPDQLAPILPAAVTSFRSKLHPDDIEETDIKGVNNHEVIFHLILAVQQLSRRVQEFESGLAVGALKGENN